MQEKTPAAKTHLEITKCNLAAALVVKQRKDLCNLLLAVALGLQEKGAGGV